MTQNISLNFVYRFPFVQKYYLLLYAVCERHKSLHWQWHTFVSNYVTHDFEWKSRNWFELSVVEEMYLALHISFFNATYHWLKQLKLPAFAQLYTEALHRHCIHIQDVLECYIWQGNSINNILAHHYLMLKKVFNCKCFAITVNQH